LKITFLFIGRTKDKNLDTLIKYYLARISRYIPSQIRELKENHNIAAKDTAKKIQTEGEQFLAEIDKGDFTILLDEGGKEFASKDFSKFLSQKFNSGIKQINFIIGGPFGLSDKLREASSVIISLSKFTFTHEISRLVLLEQVYRALTIIRGERYHY